MLWMTVSWIIRCRPSRLLSWFRRLDLDSVLELGAFEHGADELTIASAPGDVQELVGHRTSVAFLGADALPGTELDGVKLDSIRPVLRE
jgi:hypothetical protein